MVATGIGVVLFARNFTQCHNLNANPLLMYAHTMLHMSIQDSNNSSSAYALPKARFQTVYDHMIRCGHSNLGNRDCRH